MKNMLSLRQRILRYLKSHPGVWISGGEIERLALSKGYKASNASRRCRELREEGFISDKEVKGTVWYAFEPKTSPSAESSVTEALLAGNRWFNSI